MVKLGKHQPKTSDLGLIRRLLNRVKLDDKTGCWVWTGCRHHRDGYGQIKYYGKTKQVHRMAYAIFNGEIPAEMTVEHICNNPTCCNPAHMVLMTQRENCCRKDSDMPF